MSKAVGIVGAGKFGLALSKLASENSDVILYSRRTELVDEVNRHSRLGDITFKPNVVATSNLKELATKCDLIIPVIASVHFRPVMKELGAYLGPQHVVIHGTKGFDLRIEEFSDDSTLTIEDIKTMSDVVKEESNVLRVGALTGPNLAGEILLGLPTATVIASEFDQVILKGRKALSGKAFFVFGSHDLKGAELAGAFKNILALASGIVSGNALGKNVQAMLITLGLREMMLLGEAMGANPKSFLGTAGIGDLVATATSKKSRNFSCGLRLAKGESLQDILDSMEEVAEGVRSLKVAYYIIHKNELQAPLTKAIYAMVFEGKDVLETIDALMKLPFSIDMDLA